MATFDRKVKRLPIFSNDRDSWLQARRLGIGASDVAAIMGVDDYRGPLAVYEEKISELPPEDSAGEAAQWGNIFEGPILTEYSRRSSRAIRMGGQLLQSKENPRWQVTLDAEQRVSAAPEWSDGPGIAECKTVGYGNKAWKDELPRRVQVQMQFQMMVTGAQWATCVWLPFPERTLLWRDVAVHEGFVDVMRGALVEFWRRVELRSPPPPNAMDSARAALRRLYPDVSETAVQFERRGPGSLDAVAIADQFQDIQAQLKELEERKRLIGNLMLSGMRDDKWALLPDGRYWSQASVAAREEHCPSCDAVVREVKGSSRITLREPSKAPKPIPKIRVLVPNEDDEPNLVKLLGESIARLTEGK